jgi:hypothetical protein
MADMMCPLSFEDLDTLLADEQLSSELAAIFEYSARTIEVPGGYEMELTEAEARTLLNSDGPGGTAYPRQALVRHPPECQAAQDAGRSWNRTQAVRRLRRDDLAQRSRAGGRAT